MERELIELWRQLLRILLPYLWHTFSNSDDIPCNLQLATSLSDFQYKTILLASGIMAKRGDSYAFKKNGIEGLQVAVKDSLKKLVYAWSWSCSTFLQPRVSVTYATAKCRHQ